MIGATSRENLMPSGVVLLAALPLVLAEGLEARASAFAFSVPAVVDRAGARRPLAVAVDLDRALRPRRGVSASSPGTTWSSGISWPSRSTTGGSCSPPYCARQVGARSAGKPRKAIHAVERRTM